MTSTHVSIAFDQESLARLTQLMAASSMATGVHCGDDDDD